MQLSAETYLQLVNSLRSEPRRGREKRGGARVGVSGQLAIQVPAAAQGTNSDAKRLIVHLRDLSVDGIGITAAQQLSAGTQFVVTFQRDQGGTPLEMICQVCHCLKQVDRVYKIGARFISDNAGDARFGVGKHAKRIQQAMFQD